MAKRKSAWDGPDRPRFKLRERKPAWARSDWVVAINLLALNRVETAADLLERGEPIPPELGQILAAALRGDPRLPFKLKVKDNPAPDGKKRGRRPELHTFRDITLAWQMHELMQDGQRYEDASRIVAERFSIGERTVQAAYNEHKAIAPDWLATAQEFRALRDKKLQD